MFFHLFTHFLAAFSSFLFCCVIAARSERSWTHLMSCYLVADLGMGFLLRSIYWLTHNLFFLQMSYICFFTFPILLLLLSENLSKKNAPLILKILSLLLLIFFSLTFPFHSITVQRPWKITLMIFQMVLMIASVLLLFLNFRKQQKNRDSEILKSFLFGLSLAIMLLILDWFSGLALVGSRVGPLAELVMLHFLFKIFTAEGNFTFKNELVGVILFCSLGLVSYSILWLAVPEDKTFQFRVLFISGFMMLIPFELVRWLLLKKIMQKETSPLEKMTALMNSDSANLISQIAKIDEVEGASFIEEAWFKEQDCMLAFNHMCQVPIISFDEVKKALKKTSIDNASRRCMEQLNHAFLVHHTHYLSYISSENKILCLRFSENMDEKYYREFSMAISLLVARMQNRKQYV